MSLSIFTLGSPGSYGDQARHQILPHSIPIFVPTNPNIVTSVVQHRGIGIVPVSNPYGGSVNESWEALEKYREHFIIAGSHILPLDHAVVQRREHVGHEIGRIFSHPQAYSQSKISLDKLHPSHEFVPSKSTIGALDMISSPGDSAICSAGAIRGNTLLREQYQIVQETISPADNATKFVVIATSESVSNIFHLPPSEIDILNVSLSDTPGQLGVITTWIGNLGVNIHEWDKAKTIPGISPLYSLLLITSRLPRDKKMLSKFNITTITQKEDVG